MTEIAKTKIIFLDVDGVLNDSATKERTPGGYVGVDDDKIEVLAEIVRQAGAQIVLSSSWKEIWQPMKDDSENAADEEDTGIDPDGAYLNRRLAEHGLTILDRTVDRVSNRGEGIVDWLMQHDCSGWIAIDDEVFPDFKHYGITAHLVQTTYYGSDAGLSKKHVRIAMKRFRVDPTPRIQAKSDSANPFRHIGRP